MMRAVKCTVITPSAWPEKPKQRGCYTPMDACYWILDQGWGHVMHADCDLEKCKTARQFVLEEKVIMNAKNRPIVNYGKVYGWSTYPMPAGAKLYTPPVPKETVNAEQEPKEATPVQVSSVE